ncbi:MAG TPA: HAMP domain-containing methyl-accepting chemotaxis protein [Acidisoma sp.]|uniref:methyl-accepting chemotaxis protein n=1 Tax=Acidisoma sp. TaxID=1872115 RepID=UPI002C7B8A27|nr:HAMP domain-containing methyl-accepting chemotaxis protein [Acidisoma sp.]HTI02507.1 HAMP domain-containing methyl-accepting chemotaxis protein [Acidisoma sp.]
MKNAPITAKIMLILGIFGLFVLGVAFYATGQIKHIGGSYDALIRDQNKAALSLSQASRNMQTARASIADLALSNTAIGNQAAIAELREATQRFTELSDLAARSSPEHTREIDSLKAQALDVLKNGCGKAIADAMAATQTADILASQATFLGLCAPLFPPLTDAYAKEVDGLSREAEQAQKSLQTLTGRTILITYGGIILGLVIIGMIGFFGARAWIIRPIRNQIAIMARLSGGDFDTEVDGTERKDEVGAIARAVAIFRDAGREKVRLEAETAEQRAHAEEQRSQQEAQRAHSAQQATTVVESLAMGLEKLSGGDLLFRLEHAFSSEYEKLRRDFNGAMDKLLQTMKSISLNTQGVRSGAGEISQASDDLSRRTEQQAASLEETAAALDEITATVRRTAESATEARGTASAAKTDAEQSGNVVRETVTAMSGIETSSKQIGNIIGVIDEIAFQTNLLALNAGVEAARAGEAGRGFAVVATEVRALAQRSADAAKEIKTLISASSRQVESGVRLVGETGKALDRIADQVSRLNGLIGDIASSAQEQSTGLAEVNSAMNQMDQVTQQNAAMVEEATAASHSLAKEAETLGRLVSQFRLGGGAEAGSAQGAASSKRPAGKPAPAAKPSGGAPSPRAPAPRAAPLPASARPAPAMAAAEDDGWSEF